MLATSIGHAFENHQVLMYLLTLFFTRSSTPISAVWAVDVDELLLLGEARPMTVIHNPLASIGFREISFPLSQNMSRVLTMNITT